MDSDDTDDYYLRSASDGGIDQSNGMDDVSSKMDSELGFVKEGRLMDVDGNGNGESGRKSRKDDNAGFDSLIEAILSRCKDPESAYEDMMDGLPIREFLEQEKEAKRKRRRTLEMVEDDRRNAMLFADRLQEEARRSSKEAKELIAESSSFSGPFALAFRKMKDEVDRLKSEGQPLVKWVPAKERNHCPVPSLVDLSMAVLVRNAEFISSLDRVPYAMREKIADLVCDYRKMDINFMRLLAAGSPMEISVKDCSWMTIEQFKQIFGSCDFKNLMVLRLELCGRFMFDFTLRDSFARSSAKFYALATLSLKGAAGLTDEGLNFLTQLAPLLESVNLSQCSLVTAHGIHNLAKSYSSSLKELYVDECPMIDAMLMLPALTELKSLQVLSVAGISTVTDEFVGKISEVCGSNMKEMSVADCRNLTDKSIEVLGAKCPTVISLDLSNLNNLSDLSLQYIAHGCQKIRRLILQRNRFSDEAIGAFLEVSGQSLTELSLKYIRKVGPGTALSIARYAKDLETLDLSWCRNLSDETVGLIVDSCGYLKLLKLFGCTQITEMLLKGHSNRIIRIVGPTNMPMRDIDGLTKIIEGPLRDSQANQ